MSTQSEISTVSQEAGAPDYEALYKQHLAQHQFMMSQISHEIRNPVALINSFLQLLENRYPDLSTDHCFIKVMENMEFLKSLLNEFSDFNNSEKMKFQDTNLYHLFSDIVESTRPVLEEQGIFISLVKETPIPLMPADSVKLRQMLHNLIRNASEAIGSEGTITCTIKSDGETVSFLVKDTGKGILPEQQKTIFEPFTTYKQEGTGLGLSICKRIATAHDGTISFESEPGCGTTFTVVVPVK